MRVKFWGVRGSIPTPFTTEQLQSRLADVLRGAAGVDLSDPAAIQAYIAGLPPALRSLVGGNTTCVEIETGNTTIIVDCGSGMRPLGLSLMSREFGLGMGTAHIFLTHAHWDHLQGYPFFAPAYVPGNRLIFYAIGHDPRYYLEHQQAAPGFFPIPPGAMMAEKEYVRLREGQSVQIGRTLVTSHPLYHPGTAYAYRFDDGESVFAFASDGEYKSLDERHLRPYIEFFSDADALAFDSQYSLRDVFLSKEDWGHSSAIIGVDIAERARAKRLITFHHDPTNSDEQIYEIARAAVNYARTNEIAYNTEVIVAHEGLELYLGQALGLEILEDRHGTAWTFAAAGRLDRSTAPEAQRRLSEFLSDADSRPVVLDLNLVSVIDGMGVMAILDSVRETAHAALAMVASTAHVHRTLTLSAVERTVPILRNQRQALSLLTGPARWLKDAPELAGQYTLGRILAVDDLGVVFAASDRSAGDDVVAYIVGGGARQLDRSQFESLAQRWVGVSHPLLLAGRRIVGESDWMGYVGEWTEGLALRDWLRTAPSFAELLRCAQTMAEAMAHLHTAGIRHGDFHPENVVVADGRPRVSLSPLFPGHGHPSASAYRSPEQLRGAAPSLSSDVYALGIVIYELLLGVHPFAAETDDLMITLKLRSDPQTPRARWPGIPDRLEALLVKALAPDAEDRFPSAVETHAALRAIVPEVILTMVRVG